jgi:hypothetical protein
MTAIRQSKFSVGDIVRIAEKYKASFNSIKGEGTVKLVRPYGERNLYLVEFDNKKFQTEFLSYQLDLVQKKTASKSTKTTKNTKPNVDAIPKINKEELNAFTKCVDKKNIEMVNDEVRVKEQKPKYPTIEDHEEPKFNVGQAVIFTPNALLLLKEKSNINVNEMYKEFIVTAHNIIGGKYVYNLRETNLRVSENDIVLAATDQVKAHLQILDLMSKFQQLKNSQQKYEN